MMINSKRGRIENLVVRIQSAFIDDPMLSMTPSAAEARFGIDEMTCAGVLDALVDAQVLTRREGLYSRKFRRAAVNSAA